ncbi:MAG: hypothetical protein V4582_22930 [Pseudomonadota bacterium]
MNEHKVIELRTHTYRQLLNLLRSKGDTRTAEQVVEQALQAWMASASGTASGTLRGYQWKSLFLPDGTQIRMKHGHEYVYANVRGDHIDYQGMRMSPRHFVIFIAGSVRNAWRELWLLCPGDHMWHLADVRRRILRRVHSPLPAIPAPPTPPANAPCAEAASATEDAHVSKAERVQLRALDDALHALHRRSFLHRDDIVRDDQPDLSRQPLGTRLRSYCPGRPGLRDRRDAQTDLRRQMWAIRSRILGASRAPA